MRKFVSVVLSILSVLSMFVIPERENIIVQAEETKINTSELVALYKETNVEEISFQIVPVTEYQEEPEFNIPPLPKAIWGMKILEVEEISTFQSIIKTHQLKDITFSEEYIRISFEGDILDCEIQLPAMNSEQEKMLEVKNIGTISSSTPEDGETINFVLVIENDKPFFGLRVLV